MPSPAPTHPTITILESVAGAVLVDTRGHHATAYPPVFDSAADARAFLAWQFGQRWASDRELGWKLVCLFLRHVGSTMSRWRRERGWPECPYADCSMRVEPGHDACESCRCDTYHEEQDRLRAGAS